MKKSFHFIFRTLKTNNNQQQQQQQGNVQLPTTPLPPGQVGVGVSVGDPPNIESPPALEVGSLMTSPAGSNVSNTSYQQVKFSAINGVGNSQIQILKTSTE